MMLLAAAELLASRDGYGSCFGSCLEVLIFVGILVVVVITRTQTERVRLSRYIMYRDATTNRPGARVQAARRVERDLIELPGPPCRARIRFFHHGYGSERIDYTEFLAEPEWRGGAMRVTTPEWQGGLERYYGGRDIQVGDGDFDRGFIIQSNPEDLAGRFLDEVARNAIMRLSNAGDGAFLFQVRPGQLLLRVSERVSGGGLERFIRDCYALVERTQGMTAVDGVPSQTVPIGADAMCQVCGSKIEPEKRVLCRRCRTPHHMDCWTYNDGCSTYACGERRSVRA